MWMRCGQHWKRRLLPRPDSLSIGLRVLQTADPVCKARLTLAAVAALRGGGPLGRPCVPPVEPARPVLPRLVAPKDLPKRRKAGTRETLAVMLHALAHIELNAIDLAWDILLRFPDVGWPGPFYAQWLKVAADEARHFLLLRQRLSALGYAYGDFAAHRGLWQAAMDTAADPLGRLAVVPLVLEARGLDVTPGMIARSLKAGDILTARIMRVIYADEITHVQTGKRWFDWLCRQQGLDPLPTWQARVRQYFHGDLKPPFNESARDQAGLSPSYYWPLVIKEQESF